LHDVADELAHRERRLAVAAAVLQRHRRAVVLAEEEHRLVEEDAAAHLPRHLMVPRRDIPGVTHVHKPSLP